MFLPNISVKPQYMAWQIVEEKSGLIVKEGKQHNLVLTQASEQYPLYGFSGVTNFAVVGTGSTAPNVAQTGLTSESVRTNTVPSGESDSVTQFANGVFDIRKVRQFTAAQVGGLNLAEWGFSPVVGTGANLAVRELFRDGGNNPIVVTPSATQLLRLIYVSRVTFAPLSAVGSVNVAGVGNRTGTLFLTNQCYTAIDAFVRGAARMRFLEQNITASYAASGFFGGGSPQYNAYERGANALAYVANSKTRSYNGVLFDENAANVTCYGFGLSDRTDPFLSVNVGAFFKFDAGQEFTKTNLYRLTVQQFGVTWT
jgi:hypothetical protein